MRVTPEW